MTRRQARAGGFRCGAFRLALALLASATLVQCKTPGEQSDPGKSDDARDQPDPAHVQELAETLCGVSANTLTTPVETCPETNDDTTKKECKELRRIQANLGISSEMKKQDRKAIASLYTGMCKDLVRSTDSGNDSGLVGGAENPDSPDSLDERGVRIFSQNLERVINEVFNKSSEGDFARVIQNLLTSLTHGVGAGFSGGATVGPLTGQVGLRALIRFDSSDQPSLGVYCVGGGGLALPGATASAHATVLRSFCGNAYREQGVLLNAAFQTNAPLVVGSVDGGVQISVGIDPERFLEGLNIDNFAAWQAALLRDIPEFSREMVSIASRLAEGEGPFARKAGFAGGQAILGVVAQLLERDENGALQKPESKNQSLTRAVAAFNKRLSSKHILDSLMEDRPEDVRLPVREGMDIVLAALRPNRDQYPEIYGLLERIRKTLTGCDFIAGSVSGSIGFGAEEDGSPFGASATYSHYSHIETIKMKRLRSTFGALGSAARTLESARETAAEAKNLLRVRRSEVKRIREELNTLHKDFDAAVNKRVTGNDFVDGAINGLTWQFTFAARQFSRAPDRFQAAIDAAGRRLGDAVEVADEARTTLEQANRTAFRAAKAAADAMKILGSLNNPVKIARQCVYKPARYYEGIAQDFFLIKD